MDGTIRNTGAEGLLEILCCGLERDAEQRKANRLGDRSRYVGLSDIARMLDCPRAALAAKLCLPEYKNAGEALKHQLLLQRGHWFETGVHQALMGYALSPLSQLEIEISRRCAYQGPSGFHAHLHTTSTHSTDSGSQIHRKAAGNAFWEPCHADRRSDGIAQSLLESARL